MSGHRKSNLRCLRWFATAEVGAEVWQDFMNDIAAHRMQFVALDDMLVQDAADLLSELHLKVPLRTLDALHLATFLSADVGPLFTKDARMLRAAAEVFDSAVDKYKSDLRLRVEASGLSDGYAQYRRRALRVGHRTS